MRLATIDLGTNSVRFLVADTAADGWRVVEEAQRVTRLGEGEAATGALGPVPMARTAATVADYVRRAEALGATRVRITGTSAVREAANRAEFVARVESVTGMALEVLSGEDEARLTLLGVRSGLPDLEGRFVLFDIGGGSTEFVVADDDRLERALSLRLGVVGLAERHVDGGRLIPARWAAMRAEVAAALESAVPGALGVVNAARLVGTAGTVTTLAALDLGLAAYDAGRVQGHVLRRGAIERLLARLGGLTLAARAALPCLEPGRADVLIPGIAICLAVMERLGFDALTVSDRSLREGILCEILATPGADPEAPRDPRP
jgi:exopolyphosphatase / guanosine-5'-triphosphate,3'-diphosphate pyrophosphatase